MIGDDSWPPSQSLLSGKPIAATTTTTAAPAAIVRTRLGWGAVVATAAATGAGFDAFGCGGATSSGASTTGAGAGFLI